MVPRSSLSHGYVECGALKGRLRSAPKPRPTAAPAFKSATRHNMSSGWIEGHYFTRRMWVRPTLFRRYPARPCGHWYWCPGVTHSYAGQTDRAFRGRIESDRGQSFQIACASSMPCATARSPHPRLSGYGDTAPPRDRASIIGVAACHRSGLSQTIVGICCPGVRLSLVLRFSFSWLLSAPRI